MVQNPPQSGGPAFLSEFWRDIIHDLGIKPETYTYLLELYVQKSTYDAQDPEEAKQRAKTREHRKGNLKRELGAQSMTIKVLLKGLQMVGATRVTFIVRLEFGTGWVTEHSKAVQFVHTGPPQDLPVISSPNPKVVVRRPHYVACEIPQQYQLVE